jgi:hypothetical protein
VGRGRVAGSQLMCTAVTWSPNKLWRATSIFNLWVPWYLEVGGGGEGNVEGEEVLVPRLVLDLARGGALDAILHAKLEHVRGRGHVYLVVGPF